MPPKSWISYPDCQGAHDKQLTQYLLLSGQNGRCSKKYRIVETLGFVYRDTKMAKIIHGPVWKTQSFLLIEMCTVIFQQDCYWKRQFEKILLKWGWEKVPNCECSFFVHREEGLFSSVYVDDIKLVGKKQNINPMWNVLNKEVDSGQSASFFEHVYLGCTQRLCEISKDIVDNYRSMFESRISEGATGKLPCSENLRISSWSYDMEGHTKKCVERFLSWRTKRLNNSTRYQHRALTTIISKKN